MGEKRWELQIVLQWWAPQLTPGVLTSGRANQT